MSDDLGLLEALDRTCDSLTESITALQTYNKSLLQASFARATLATSFAPIAASAALAEPPAEPAEEPASPPAGFLRVRPESARGYKVSLGGGVYKQVETLAEASEVLMSRRSRARVSLLAELEGFRGPRAEADALHLRLQRKIGKKTNELMGIADAVSAEDIEMTQSQLVKYKVSQRVVDDLDYVDEEELVTLSLSETQADALFA